MVRATDIPHLNQAAKESGLMQPTGPAFYLDLDRIATGGGASLQALFGPADSGWQQLRPRSAERDGSPMQLGCWVCRMGVKR